MEDGSLKVTEVALDIIQEHVMKHVSMLDLNPNHFSFESFAEYTAKAMVLELTRNRAAQDLGVVTFQVPETWFDHFKEKFYPKFLLKLFPIKYKKLTVGASAFYDRIAIPEQATQVRLHVMEGADKVL